MNKDELELEMSVEVPKQRTVEKKLLPLDTDKDTSFDVFFDIYKSEAGEYLYIKLVENSAVAPFYYDHSYSIEDLRKIHRIFHAVNMEQAKSDLNDLFEAQKVKLFYDKETDGIKMELEVLLFVKKYNFSLDLNKKMIPEEEKDDQLINLYEINKRKLKFAKEMYSFLKSQGNIDKKIFDALKENFDLDDGAEANNQIIEVHDIQLKIKYQVDDEKLKAIFIKEKKGFLNKDRKENEDYMFQMELKNKTDNPWPQDFVKFKLDEKKSKIFCKNIVYPFYETDAGQKGLFEFYFDAKSKSGKYTCFFDVFINEEPLNDTQLKLKITIPEEEEE